MPSEDLLKSTISIRVRFQECDPLQIVWHGNYLKYFEEGREDFCRRHGISYLDAMVHGISTPIVQTLSEHKSPLKYGDEFEVETTFINSKAAKLVFEYRILKKDKIVCTGRTVQVFLNEKRELLLKNPQFFLDWKKKMGLQ